MKIKDQVLSIEQVLKLQELGFDVSKYATLCWASCDKCPNEKCFERQSLELNMSKGKCCVNQTNFIPTLTIGDIIDVLPETIITEYCGRYIRSHIEINKKVVCYPCYDKNGEVSIMLFHSMQEILIDSLFDCVVWCIKEKHIKI